jgi:hypothetical protein
MPRRTIFFIGPQTRDASPFGANDDWTPDAPACARAALRPLAILDTARFAGAAR